MNIRSKLAGLLAAVVAFFTVTAPAYAEDVLGNTATAAFSNLRDTQDSMAPLVLGVIGFTVVLGLAIRWTRKAG